MLAWLLGPWGAAPAGGTDARGPAPAPSAPSDAAILEELRALESAAHRNRKEGEGPAGSPAEGARTAARRLADAAEPVLGNRHVLVQRLRTVSRSDELLEVATAVRAALDDFDAFEEFDDAPEPPATTSPGRSSEKQPPADGALHCAAMERDADAVARVAARVIIAAERAAADADDNADDDTTPLTPTTITSTAHSCQPPHIVTSLEAWDAAGRTALHCAVLRSDPERLAVAGALLDAGMRPSAPDRNGWTPLDVASLQGDRAMVELLYSRWLGWARFHFVRRQPVVRHALRSVPDFSCTLKWRLDSRLFGAFVRFVSPDDTYRIYKRGGSLRIDSTLAGYDGTLGMPRWRRGRLSLLLLPDDDGGAKARLLLMNHDDRTVVDMTEPPREVLEELGSMAPEAVPESPPTPAARQRVDYFHRDCWDDAGRFGESASEAPQRPGRGCAPIDVDDWRAFSPHNSPAFEQEVDELLTSDLEQGDVSAGEFAWKRAKLRSGTTFSERVGGRDTVVYNACARVRLRKLRMRRDNHGVVVGGARSYDAYLAECASEGSRREAREMAARAADAALRRPKGWGEWLARGGGGGAKDAAASEPSGHVLTGDADGEADLDEFGTVSARSRLLKGRVWLARGLPIRAEHLLPVLEACSTFHRHLTGLHRLVAGWVKRDAGDSDLFPVQVKVPLAMSVYAYVGIDEVAVGPQDPRLFVPPAVSRRVDDGACPPAPAEDRAVPVLCARHGAPPYRALDWASALRRLSGERTSVPVRGAGSAYRAAGVY